MFKVILPVLLIVLAVYIGMNTRGGLVRGVADGMLVSPARPAVAVRPAPAFALADARRADLAPPVQGSMLHSTSVQVFYALYDRETPDPARLAAVLAISPQKETWPVQPEMDFPVLRHQALDLDGFSGFADTYVLPAADDPWHDEAEAWTGGSLVRRFTFILWFYKAKLIVEYREPLPAPTDLPLADNLPALAAFEGRALSSFNLLSGDAKKGGVTLPKPTERLPYPPAGVNRQALTAFIGQLWDVRN